MSDPLRLVHRNASRIIHDLAKHIYTITRPTASTIWIGRGWDDDRSEHQTGRALDIIVARKVGSQPTAEELAAGWAVVDWLVAHASALRIRHIIFRRRIYRHRYRAWGKLPNRDSTSSISDWHDDHAHVLLESESGYVPDHPLTQEPPMRPPLAPTDLTVDITLPDRFRLAWQNHTTDDQPITRTEIWRTDRTTRSACIASFQGQRIWWDDTEIVRDQAYTYTVVAFNAAGKASAVSQTVYTAPAPPAALTLTRDGSYLAADWSDASFTATSFEVEHELEEVWTGHRIAAEANSYAAEVHPGRRHRVRVRALAPDGTPSSWTISGYTRKENQIA